MNQPFINAIVTHATINQDNLRMAIQVHAAFNAIKSDVIDKFLNLLINELATALTDIPGIVIDIQPLLAKPSDTLWLSIYHPSWPKDWSVGIEAQSPTGKEFIIGVGANKDKVADIDRNAIKAKLDTDIALGNISDWWPWYRKVKSDFNDWSQEDILIDLFKQYPRQLSGRFSINSPDFCGLENAIINNNAFSANAQGFNNPPRDFTRPVDGF